jgi:hypothetical protein
MAKNTNGIAEIAKTQNKQFKSITRLYEKYHGFAYEIVIGKDSHLIAWKQPASQLYDEVKKIGIDQVVVKYNFDAVEASRVKPGADVNEIQEDADVDINEQFQALDLFLDMLFDRKCQSQSLVIAGPGGIGKSFEVFEYLEKHGHSFKLVKGYSSPRALFNTLRNNADSTVIFDDCDAIWEAPESLNILKSAMETNRKGKRIVCWNLADQDEEFEFNGQVVFLSNKDFFKAAQKNKHIAAVLTRVLFVQITNNAEQVMRRIEHVAAKQHPNNAEMRKACLEFMKQEKYARVSKSIRLYEHLANIFTKFGKEKFELLAKETMRGARLA